MSAAQHSHGLITHQSALAWKDEPPEAHCFAVMSLNNVGSLRKYIGQLHSVLYKPQQVHISTCAKLGMAGVQGKRQVQVIGVHSERQRQTEI